MKPIARLAVLALAVLASLGAAPSDKIKALIIDGQPHHNLGLWPRLVRARVTLL